MKFMDYVFYEKSTFIHLKLFQIFSKYLINAIKILKVTVKVLLVFIITTLIFRNN